MRERSLTLEPLNSWTFELSIDQGLRTKDLRPLFILPLSSFILLPFLLIHVLDQEAGLNFRRSFEVRWVEEQDGALVVG